MPSPRLKIALQQAASASISRLRSKTGVDPLTCVALEDSVNGMIASKAARMRSIVVPAPEAQNDPRFVLANVKLSSLTELTAKDLLGE